MKLKDIVRSQQEVLFKGNSIKNNIIESVNIKVIGHFNNCSALEIICSDICCLSGYNNTKNLGFLIKAFIELFDLTEEDGLNLNKIHNIPCRLIFAEDGSWGGKCIGFGHFMKDKFVYKEDFIKIDS